MHAQILTAAHRPLVASDIGAPRPAAGEVLIAVKACAVCRTDLHIVDGELDHPKLPLVPGHEIVGTVVETGAGADRFENQDLIQHERIRKAFLDIAQEEPRRCIIIDASKPEALVAEDVWEAVAERLRP